MKNLSACRVQMMFLHVCSRFYLFQNAGMIGEAESIFMERGGTKEQLDDIYEKVHQRFKKQGLCQIHILLYIECK